MELGSILQFIENRSVLVTGASGFLAKIFIEKILRVQPNEKKLCLLLRASDKMSAMLRFNNEANDYDDIMNTEILRRAAKESAVETHTFYFDPKIIN